MLPGTVPLVNVAKKKEKKRGGNTQFRFSRMALDSMRKYSCISEGSNWEARIGWGGQRWSQCHMKSS